MRKKTRPKLQGKCSLTESRMQKVNTNFAKIVLHFACSTVTHEGKSKSALSLRKIG